MDMVCKPNAEPLKNSKTHCKFKVNSSLLATIFHKFSLLSLINSLALALHCYQREKVEDVAQVQRENTLLRQKLDALARRFFGKKSEQLDAARPELLLNGPVYFAFCKLSFFHPASPLRGEAERRRA